jgi:hypothetical protein
MKRILKTIFASALLLVAAQNIQAQDVSINIISQENGVNDGDWEKGAEVGTIYILITIHNNTSGFVEVAPYTLRPLLSVTSSVAKIAKDQPGLPPGWTIITQDDETIRLSNGTDAIEAAEMREFPIMLETVGPGTFIATGGMFFSNGQAPGTAVGPATRGDLPGNNNSTTGVTVRENLPVTLSSFMVSKEGKSANLQWATTEETNSDRFEIERSADGKAWSHIGTVASVGESKQFVSYNFTDENPFNGDNIYRLKMIDLDETFTYSRVRSLYLEGGVADLSVYPNPTSDVIFVRDYKSITNISIIDLQGKVIYKADALADEAINTSSMAAGMYVIHIGRKDGSTSAQKFVIVK